jgi:hypothetical protein
MCFCVHGTEMSCIIKHGEFHELLGDRFVLHLSAVSVVRAVLDGKPTLAVFVVSVVISAPNVERARPLPNLVYTCKTSR